MSLDVAGVLAQARALQELTMTDTMRVERSDSSRYNPVTKEQEKVWTLVYEGKGRMQWGGSATQTVTVSTTDAGRASNLPIAGVLPYWVELPKIISEPTSPIWRATVLTSLDPHMPGVVCYITAVEFGTLETCRRFHGRSIQQ